MRYELAKVLLSSSRNSKLFAIAIAIIIMAAPMNVIGAQIQSQHEFANLYPKQFQSPQQNVPSGEGDRLQYWKWFYTQRSRPNGIPADAYVRAVAKRQAMTQTTAAPISGTWTSVGPAPESNCGTVGGFCSGRVSSIAVDPTNTNTVYLGAAQGGVWKSTDGGSTWVPLTDTQVSLAIGSVAVNASGHVYVGTGEGNGSCDSYYGAGVLKSTDHGSTWVRLGVSTFGRSSISQIAVSGSTIIAATNFGAIDSSTSACTGISPGVTVGIYVSTDSGSSWTNKISGTGTDVVFDPSNPLTVYAAVSGKIYKSTNGGSSWSGPLGGGFPASGVGRISLAIAASSTQTLLAAIQTGNVGALYETTNGGANWSSVSPPSNYCTGQCWYNLVVAIDPTNSDTFYVGGQDLYRSTNGGSSWTDLGGYAGYLHPDQHVFVFSPGSNAIAYSGNDGGIWKSTSVNTCSVSSCWANLNSGLSTLQFQSLAAHPTDGNSYFGGTQDNGSPGHSGSSAIWPMLVGGDGGWTAYDRNNPSTMYHTFYGVSPQRSDNGGAAWSYITNGITTSDASEFYIPMAMDPSTPTTLYLGTYRLYKTTNRGDSWSLPSPGLSLSSGLVTAIAVAPSNGLYVYVGTSGGRFYASTDGGSHFVERDTGLPTSFLTKIAVDPTNPQKVYTAFSAFGNGHVFVSSNSGSSWTNISSNLPDIPTNAVVVDATGSVIYVGTDVGVFYSADGGGSWAALGLGLPTVTIFELVFSADGYLLAASHGRSAWVFSANPVTQTITTTVTATSIQATSYASTTQTVTSYTGTSISTSTIQTVTTIVLVPVTSTVQGTQYQTSFVTTTVTSYTSTSVSTSIIPTVTTVTISPPASTIQTTQIVTLTGTATMTGVTTTTTTSYTSTQVSTSTTIVVTTVTTSSFFAAPIVALLSLLGLAVRLGVEAGNRPAIPQVILRFRGKYWLFPFPDKRPEFPRMGETSF